MDEYDIYLRGFAADKEPPELGLQRLFGIDGQRARALVLSLPRVVKQRISPEQAVRYELALRHLGADYELRKSPLRPAQTNVVGVRRDPDSVQDVRAGNVLSLPPPTTALSATAVTKSTGRHDPHAPVGQPLPPIRGTVRSAMNDGDLPPPWEVPGLQMEGRADWVVDGPEAFESMPSPAQPTAEAHAPSLPTARRAGAMRDSASGSAPALRGGALSGSAPALRGGASSGHRYRTGSVHSSEPPARGASRLARTLVPIALGIAVLTIALAAVRQFHLLDPGALARIRGSTAAEAEPSANDDPLTPVALDWAQSDLHQFSNGDKERVRALIGELDHAGAVQVRAGHILPNGQVLIAAELVVVLPRDPALRKAVFAVYERFLRAAFGDFVAAPKDDGTELLHIAL